MVDKGSKESKPKYDHKSKGVPMLSPILCKESNL